MDFSKRKLPREASETLRNYPVETLRPFVLMISPVYVYLKRNEKFISVKGPLDFFTEKEIDKIRPYESIFLPLFVDKVLPFAQTGRHVRALLKWAPRKEDILPPAPYELSDAILKLIGPLWNFGPLGSPIIEPFFVTAFANELCEPLDEKVLLEARETNIHAFEVGIFRSSWAVFLALHLGFCDLDFLNRLRVKVFADAVRPGSPRPTLSEVDQLMDLARETMAGLQIIRLDADQFAGRADRISQKLANRLQRIKEELIDPKLPLATIFGVGGIADA